MCTGASFLGGKVTGVSVSPSSLSSVDVKTECSNTCVPRTCLLGVDRDKFTFICIYYYRFAVFKNKMLVLVFDCKERRTTSAIQKALIFHFCI